MIDQGLDLLVLVIIRNTNYWCLGRLDNCNECLETSAVACTYSIHFIHQNYGLFSVLTAKQLDKLVLLIILLLCLPTFSPVVDALIG